jgi:hypothetical protein
VPDDSPLPPKVENDGESITTEPLLSSITVSLRLYEADLKKIDLINRTIKKQCKDYRNVNDSHALRVALHGGTFTIDKISKVHESILSNKKNNKVKVTAVFRLKPKDLKVIDSINKALLSKYPMYRRATDSHALRVALHSFDCSGSLASIHSLVLSMDKRRKTK